MQHVDFQGIAILIGAVGAFIVTVGNFAIQLWTFRRQWKMHEENKTALSIIETNVNGVNERIAKQAHDLGRADGIVIGQQMNAQQQPPKVTPP